MQTKRIDFDTPRSNVPPPNLRGFVRDVLVALAAGITSPLWFCTWFETRLSRSDGLFKSCSEFLSLFPGRVGIFLRRGFYSMSVRAFAADAHIGFGTIVAHPQLTIGRGAYVGDGCTLGKVEIADAVTIGSNVDI